MKKKSIPGEYQLVFKSRKNKHQHRELLNYSELHIISNTVFASESWVKMRFKMISLIMFHTESFRAIIKEKPPLKCDCADRIVF